MPLDLILGSYDWLKIACFTLSSNCEQNQMQSPLGGTSFPPFSQLNAFAIRFYLQHFLLPVHFIFRLVEVKRVNEERQTEPSASLSFFICTLLFSRNKYIHFC